MRAMSLDGPFAEHGRMEINALVQTAVVAIGIAVFFLAALVPTLLELRPLETRRQRRSGGDRWAA